MLPTVNTPDTYWWIASFRPSLSRGILKVTGHLATREFCHQPTRHQETISPPWTPSALFACTLLRFTCVCLWLAFICWKGEHILYFVPFQQIIKANHKRSWVKLATSKLSVRLASGDLYWAFSPLQNTPAGWPLQLTTTFHRMRAEQQWKVKIVISKIC